MNDLERNTSLQDESKIENDIQNTTNPIVFDDINEDGTQDFDIAQNDIFHTEVEKEPNEDIDSSAVVPDTTENNIEENKKNRLWEEKRRAYFANQEKEKLEIENEQLRNSLKQSLDAGHYHYNINVTTNLAQAKNKIKQAVMDGDLDLYAEAVTELSQATSEVAKLKDWNTQQEIRQKNIQNTGSNEHEVEQYQKLIREVANDWISQYPELQRDSNVYNKNFHDKIIEKSNQLNEELDNLNYGSTKYSPLYFKTLDNYMAELKRSENERTSKRPQPPIGGVTNINNQNRMQENLNRPLTPLEENTRIAMNVDKATFLKLSKEYDKRK